MLGGIAGRWIAGEPRADQALASVPDAQGKRWRAGRRNGFTALSVALLSPEKLPTISWRGAGSEVRRDLWGHADPDHGDLLSAGLAEAWPVRMSGIFQRPVQNADPIRGLIVVP